MLSSFLFFFPLTSFFFSSVRWERAKTNRRHCSLRALKSGRGKSLCMSGSVQCVRLCVWAHSCAAVDGSEHSSDGEGSVWWAVLSTVPDPSWALPPVPCCGLGFSLHLKTFQNCVPSLQSAQLHNPTPYTVLAPLPATPALGLCVVFSRHLPLGSHCSSAWLTLLRLVSHLLL